MAARTGSVFPRRRRGLRAGVTQLVFVLAGLGLGIAVPKIALDPKVPAGRVADFLLAIGVGVVSATAVIFSLLFLVVQWASTTFTPRLTLFRDAPVVWRTLAFAVGLSVFSITATFSIGNRPEVSVAVPAFTGFLLLVLLVLLRALQLRAFAAIQLAPALSSIAARGREVLDHLYAGQLPPPDAPVLPHTGTITWPHAPAVLQQLGVAGLRDTAAAAGAVVVLHTPPGVTLQYGTVVADVYGEALPASAVLDAFTVGSERTFDQDPLLAFRLISDIALRALSPAVNDPATAVQALDTLEGLLSPPTAGDIGLRHVDDAEGELRVVVRLPSWEDFLRTGVDDVIPAAVGSPMVLIRLRAMLSGLDAQAPTELRELLGQRLSWVEEELTGRFPRIWEDLAVRDHPARG